MDDSTTTEDTMSKNNEELLYHTDVSVYNELKLEQKHGPMTQEVREQHSVRQLLPRKNPEKTSGPSRKTKTKPQPKLKHTRVYDETYFAYRSE